MRSFVFAFLAVIAIGCSDTANPVAPSPAAAGSTAVVVPDNADHGGRALEALLTGTAIVPAGTGCTVGQPDRTGKTSSR